MHGKNVDIGCKKYMAKVYKRSEVMLSIHDNAIVKQCCKEDGISFNEHVYELIIKDMAARGIRLEGTATRNVDDIINNDALSAANHTSAPDEDCDK